ncbi:BTB/POZ domain-containing protein At5g41330 [Punica granatum]|uniref:Uncharacterized protein n=2 Tax=Punica granatum TaxID=22663 RepID=A0A2I0JCN1_PUNGR|nr:BTB/POZ domain-containing protein At5g41330 [Punica granatum]PKI53999.1 hypothetical protein CRG98_025610 [Punica granatum]
MPSLASSVPAPAMSGGSTRFQRSKTESNIVTIDVGGQMFQTTKQTLALAGPDSLLSELAGSDPSQLAHRFIDRDPELFSVLLSLLRTGNLPSKAKSFDLRDLISESEFYGVESFLVNSLSNPSQFDAFNLEKSRILELNGRDLPSTIAAAPSGSLHVVHGSKITSFDWSLRKKSTILTQFPAIDSLLEISPRIVAAGATDFPGLQILELQKGAVRASLNWENATKSASTVQAIGSSGDHLFTSFESSRRNSNCIMVYDQQSLRPVTEIAHFEIYGAEIESAVPATKLRWVPGVNLLMASGSHRGPLGMTGNIRLWDVRSGSAVWEVKERADCFSDVTFSDRLSAIFKVGVDSGEVSYMDLRSLGTESSWVCLGEGKRSASGKKEGLGCRIEGHGSQVFCSRGGDIELWSEVAVMGSSSDRSENGLQGRVFRKNLVGRAKDMGGAKITSLAFGNKMFVTRKDLQFVEVWESTVSR